MEAVAAARRALPIGGPVPQDYLFDAIGADGALETRALSSLFQRDSLAIYSMMFPRDPTDQRRGPSSGESARLTLLEAPCASCTALLDQLDGAVEHLAPLVDFVVVAKAPIERVVTFARERGWRRLRMLSSARNSYNHDYHAETASGAQRPILNVFERRAGAIHHFWGSELLYAPAEPDQDPRHVGTIEPLWNLLDLTRQGRRRDWDEQFSYECSCS
jgi:predicted dithiol-disulfide oxidoreductase (DUF899 family)